MSGFQDYITKLQFWFYESLLFIKNLYLFSKLYSFQVFVFIFDYQFVINYYLYKNISNVGEKIREEKILI